MVVLSRSRSCCCCCGGGVDVGRFLPRAEFSFCKANFGDGSQNRTDALWWRRQRPSRHSCLPTVPSHLKRELELRTGTIKGQLVMPPKLRGCVRLKSQSGIWRNHSEETGRTLHSRGYTSSPGVEGIPHLNTDRRQITTSSPSIAINQSSVLSSSCVRPHYCALYHS